MGPLVAACLALAISADVDPLLTLETRQQELFAKTAPGVVFISAGDSFGSGFFVNPRGLILTNAHVVGKKKVVDVVLHDGRRLPGNVVELGADATDLALVQVDQKDNPALPIVLAHDLKVGSWVASVGHGGGGIWSFNVGMISNIYAVAGERPIVQTQIPLHPGNSGGPIIDRQGRVVAVINRGKADSNAINFAILIGDAFERLSKLDAPCACLRITAPPKVPVFIDGQMVGAGPRVVAPLSAKPREVSAVVGGALKVKTVEPSATSLDLTIP
jgi:S1-C subfamily serine protease